jgi:hypothetical protein
MSDWLLPGFSSTSVFFISSPEVSDVHITRTGEINTLVSSSFCAIPLYSGPKTGGSWAKPVIPPNRKINREANVFVFIVTPLGKVGWKFKNRIIFIQLLKQVEFL